jgi:hypothetical protein
MTPMPNIQAAMKKTATTQPTLARRLMVLDGFLFGSFSAGLAIRDRSFLPFSLQQVVKKKHQAVSQGARRFGKRSPPEADEHLQKPCNAGSRPPAPFFNNLLIIKGFPESSQAPLAAPEGPAGALSP